MGNNTNLVLSSINSGSASCDPDNSASLNSVGEKGRSGNCRSSSSSKDLSKKVTKNAVEGLN